MFKKLSILKATGISTRGSMDGGNLEEAAATFCTRCQQQVDNSHSCSKEEEDSWDPWEGHQEIGGNSDGYETDSSGWNSGGSGGTGSSGGGGNSSGGDPVNMGPMNYKAMAGDKFAKANIPNTMAKQAGATCVFASIGFVNRLFGIDINDGLYINDYATVYGGYPVDIFLKGAQAENVEGFAKRYFTLDPFVDYRDAIDKGCVVMTDIPTSQNYNHCIVVVGYHPNGRLIYMDPEVGALKECAPSFPSGSFNVSIKSK